MILILLLILTLIVILIVILLLILIMIGRRIVELLRNSTPPAGNPKRVPFFVVKTGQQKANRVKKLRNGAKSCMTCDFKTVILLFYRERRKRLESPRRLCCGLFLCEKD